MSEVHVTARQFRRGDIIVCDDGIERVFLEWSKQEPGKAILMEGWQKWYSRFPVGDERLAALAADAPTGDNAGS